MSFYMHENLEKQALVCQDINLVSLILPSPECDKSIASGDSFTTIFKSADPRLNKDLSIGQFLVAFGAYRDVICAVFPESRKELDAYLALVGDLNRKYAKNIFYLYHKAFSRKAALHISQFNTRLDWSVLDTELLVMIARGSQMISCHACGTSGRTAPLCPSVPFNPPSIKPSQSTDRQDRQVSIFNNTPICNNFNENICTFPTCHFLHICIFCKDAHPRSVSPRRFNPARMNTPQPTNRGSKTF
ncbi:uncharacterized protein V6R79_024713 [Siganus canaliculatus]